MADANMTTATSETIHQATIVSNRLWAIAGIAIIVVGTVGHLLSIAVMMRSKSMRVYSSTVYLVSMSVTGIATLYIGLLRYVMFIGISKWVVDIRDSSDAFCKFHMALTYASLQYFAWLQATVAVDRLISVLFPHKYHVAIKWKTALVVVVVELVAVSLLNMSVGFAVGLNEEDYCKAHASFFFYIVWGYIDLLSYSLIPAVILIICNSIILKILGDSRLKTRSARSKNTGLARSLTVMLMSLNVFFLITTLPISIIFFIKWGDYGTQRYAVTELCWTIFSLLQYAGSACTFFVYCITGSKFREELKTLLSMFLHHSKPLGESKACTRNTSHTALSSNDKTSYKSLQVSIHISERNVSECHL
ncbi:probable G-protein coupled receptor 139 [Watersipora subatra]|uniref:probable G-protein coupled receptor 139 n=1 Tax=Watersipora subatra TaxID=2589382 RepID=UPI00355BC2C1